MNGNVKNICEIKKDELLIVNTFNKNNQEELFIFKKKSFLNQFQLIISINEDGKIIGLKELKDGKLLIIKENQFKINEISKEQSIIKTLQAKKLENKNEIFKEIKEFINGNLISLSIFENKSEQNKIIFWKKDLISGNFEIFKTIQTTEIPISILEINKYIFVVYFINNNLYKFNSQTGKKINY